MAECNLERLVQEGRSLTFSMIKLVLSVPVTRYLVLHFPLTSFSSISSVSKSNLRIEFWSMDKTPRFKFSTHTFSLLFGHNSDMVPSTNENLKENSLTDAANSLDWEWILPPSTSFKSRSVKTPSHGVMKSKFTTDCIDSVDSFLLVPLNTLLTSTLYW